MPFSFSRQHTRSRAHAIKPRHAQEPSTPKTSASDLLVPQQSHSSAHTQTPLNTCDAWHLGPNTARAAPSTQVRQPVPNRHGPPASAPNRTAPQGEQRRQSPPRCPARPETHQNLIHNPQRTQHNEPHGTQPRPTAATQGSTARTLLFSVTTRPTAKAQAPRQGHGGGRDRTDDLLLAKQALSQLSYAPIPKQPAPQQAAARTWWAREDLNLRPHAYQACALTN